MMLNLNLATLHDNLLRYLPIGLIVGIIFLLQSFIILEDTQKVLIYQTYTEWGLNTIPYTSIQVLGQILYTEYFPYFLIASMILFVAMIGAIVLTAHPSHAVKRQDINIQLERSISIILTDTNKK